MVQQWEPSVPAKQCNSNNLPPTKKKKGPPSCQIQLPPNNTSAPEAEAPWLGFTIRKTIVVFIILPRRNVS